MKISKRAKIKKKDDGTTDNWKKLKDSIKVCKYCKKTPSIRFDEEEEMYYMECCEDYKPIKEMFLQDAINHHISFKKQASAIRKILGVLTP